MNILFLTFEQAKIKIPILNWITAPEQGVGKSAEKYWIFPVNIPMQNPSGDYEVERFISLLTECTMRNYTHLMIGKEIIKTEE
jgi:hypothetical protein